jgi:hypothetical protein
MKLIVPCSEMQKETIAHHALGLGDLVMFPGERTWMVEQARKKVPHCRVVGAHLDIEQGLWVLEVEA